MTEYPTMLYRPGGDEIIFGHAATTIIAWDADEYAVAEAEGFGSPEDFLAAHDPLDHDGNGKKGGARKVKNDA